MDEHRGGGVDLIKAPARSGEKYDRVFKPLGAVNAEDLHGVTALRSAGARLVAALLELLHPAHEPEQPPVALLLKLAGIVRETADVFTPCRAVRHRGEQREERGVVADAREQRFDREIGREGAVALERCEKGGARFVRLRAAAERGIKVGGLIRGADGGELVRRKAEERRAQHGDERHVLPRVIDHRKQRKERCDLRGAVKPAALLRYGRDPLCGERGAVARRGGFIGAHQYGEVAVGAGTETLAVRDGRAGIHHLPDARGDVFRLQDRFVGPVLLAAGVRRR